MSVRILTTRNAIASEWILNHPDLFMKTMNLLNHLPQKELLECDKHGNIDLRIYSEKDFHLHHHLERVEIFVGNKSHIMSIDVFEDRIETNIGYDMTMNFRNLNCSIDDCINECIVWTERVRNHDNEFKIYTILRTRSDDYDKSGKIVYTKLNNDTGDSYE